MRNRLLAEGDKIEFRDIVSRADLDAGIKPRVYVSQIFEFTDKDTIRAAMPISKGKLVPLERGKRFDVFFYTSKGIYQCVCQIIDRNKSNNIYTVEIKLLTDLQKFQRRQYYRLEKTIPIYYVGLSEEDYLSILETRRFPEHMKDLDLFEQANTLDISGGGMRFVGRKKIEQGQKVLVMFDIDENGRAIRYRLPATVIISFNVPNRSGIFEHRVEYENITREYRELLIKYIFEEERKKRNVDIF